MPLSLTRSNADNAAASDALTRVRNFGRVLADGSAASDVLTRAPKVTFVMADNAAASDSLAGLVGRIGLAGMSTVAFVPSGTLQLFNLTPIVVPAHVTPNMRIVIVDRTGRPYADLPHAVVTRPPTRVLDGLGTAEFEFPTLDPKQAEVQLLTREVQFWRNGKLWWWGVMTDATADFETVKVACYTLEWYLFRRFFGPIVTHRLENRNFDDPVALNHWSTVAGSGEAGVPASSSAGFAASRVATPIILGPNTAKLSCPNANADAYISQRITVSAGVGEPVVYFPKAWYWLDPAGFQGPAYNERGLFAILYDESGTEVQRASHGGLISSSHGRGTWQRLELTGGLNVAAGRSWTLEVRLYAPGGTIYWGANDVTVEESVSSPNWPTGSDVNALVQAVIAYAQDPTQLKSDLSFLYSGGNTGVSIFRSYQFFDNANIWQSLLEYCTSNIADMDVRWDALGRTRTFFLYPGQKGKVRPQWPVAQGRNIVGGSLEVRGSDTTTSERVLSSEPNGPNRETGVSIDTSQLGGLILEQVDSVGQEIPISGLQTIADKHIGRFRSTTRIPSYTIAAEGFIDNVDTGDTVPVTLDQGWLQEHDLRRVVSMGWDPSEDTVILEVNAP